MTASNPRPGYLRRALDAFITARERQADRFVSRTLLSMDDATLSAHGYSRGDLERRAGRTGY